jgi:hypothetical protein
MANSLNPIELERFGAEEPETRCCDWPGCDGEGEHRAPKSRNELKSYHWFCLIHVRQYNAGWNFYDGMSDAEVEADVRRDTVWHRPSWPLGGNNGDGKYGNFPFTADDLMDQMGEFGPEWDPDGGFGQRPDRNAKPGTRQAWAVAVFGLSGPVVAEAVKARYKELVKQHHPDTNGGAKAGEEKIKEINEAYQIIMDMLKA